MSTMNPVGRKVEKWTPESKRALITHVLQQNKSISTKEILKSLAGADTTEESIRTAYYKIIRKEPEFVRLVIEDLRSKGIPPRDPYRNRNTFVEQDLATEEPRGEEEILLSAGELIEELTKLGKVIDIVGFLNGLTTLVKKASSDDRESLLEQKEKEIQSFSEENKSLSEEVEFLKQKNQNYVETLEYVSTIIHWYSSLTTGQKIMNSSKVTNDLMNSIYSRIRSETN